MRFISLALAATFVAGLAPAAMAADAGDAFQFTFTSIDG